MELEEITAISNEVLESCTLENGKLVLTDDTFLSFAKRIRDAADQRGWAQALVALVNRLRDVPGAGPAAEKMTALAAFALGDAEVTSLVNRELARR